MRLAPLFTNIYFYFMYHIFVSIEQKSWETNIWIYLFSVKSYFLWVAGASVFGDFHQFPKL